MALVTGTKLGHFEILAPLGAGAMGEVYRARDDRLKRDVALKVLPAQTVADERARKRLRTEALALSKLNHPNIASIHEYGSHSGVDFLVMEYVDGETLAARLSRGPLQERELTAIALQIAEALRDAHEQGIVHRDLKPGNVMVTKRGRTKVLDFGLARAPVAEDSTAESLSSAEGIVGTLPYMAPEQLRTGKIDTRADLYALGVILYEMATGRRPFGKEELAGLVRDILDRRPEPPRRLNPALSPRLETIVLKALRKSPDERHQSADELIAELQGVGPMTVPAPPTGERIGNLARPRTSFVGREREVLEAKRSLESTRLLTLTGSGGCGKTRLALELAETVRDAYPDGVWLVELAAVVDPVLVPQAVAAAMGIREQIGRPLIETLTESLASQRVLIVLDNCEHLLAAAGHVVEAILDAGPGPRILATSREALGVAGEEARRVPSLSVPGPAEQDSKGDAGDKRPHMTAGGGAVAATKFEAVRLFVERASSAIPTFSLTDSNAAIAARICRRLDGIPLAIELAAARLKVLTPEEIDRRLDDCFRLLAGGGRTALPRHQTLRALIDWSYNLLTDRERLLFRRLSVFAGGWSVADAEAVCADAPGDRHPAEIRIDSGDILDLVTALVDKSLVLVQEVAGEIRCRYLETVRQYGMERLTESGEADALRARHRDHFLEIAMANAYVGRPEEHSRLDRVHDDMRVALEWSISGSAPPDKGLLMAATLVNYWSVRGYFSEGRRWLTALLDRGDATPEARARALRSLGKIDWLETKFDEAMSKYQQILALYEEIGDKAGVASALSGIGSVLRHLGDHPGARVAYERSLALYREIGHQWGIAGTLNDLGIVASNAKEIERAIALYQESLAISREQGDVWGIASRLGNLAEVTTWKGDTNAALAMHRESLSLWVELGDRRSIAEGLEMLAETLCAQGRMDRVATVLGAVEAMREEIGCPRPPVDDELIEGAAASARTALGAEEFVQAWAEGRAMGQDRAVACALGQEIGAS